MGRKRRSLLGLLAAGATAAAFLPGQRSSAAQDMGSSAGSTLIGAWLVSASRATGQGVVLLTFNADGTFLRSADTHPVQTVGHGVWSPTTDGNIDGMYIALRFDENRAHIGSQKTRIRITLGPEPDQFTGVGKVSTLGLDGSVQGTSQTQLQGKRIVAEPFDA